MLSQFTMATGCHRKAAIRLLHRGIGPRAKRKRGRPRRDGDAVVRALRVLWQASDRLCGKRLHPFLPELVSVLRRHGDISITAEVEAQLCRMSPATIDRLLRPYRLVGYDRYDSKAASEALSRVYDLTRLYVNFFPPLRKLVHKTRHRARVPKVYDTARTPYQRLLAAGILTEAKQQELAASYRRLNPTLLLRQINENLEHLWTMARYPTTQARKDKTKEAPVTPVVRQPLAPR